VSLDAEIAGLRRKIVTPESELVSQEFTQDSREVLETNSQGSKGRYV
jgi:hypothetical protein